MGVKRYNGVGFVTSDELNEGLATKQDTPATEGTEGQVLSINANGDPAWVSPAEGSYVDTEMSDDSPNPVKNSVIKAYVDGAVTGLDEEKADKNGYYQGMTVGLAENLIDTKGTGSEQEFVFRTSCGEESISDDGSAIIQTIKGKTLKWNQICANGDFSNGTTGWANIESITDGVAHIIGTTESASATVNLTLGSITYAKNHKYLFRIFIKGVFGKMNILPTGSTADGTLGYVSVSTTAFDEVSYIWTCPELDTYTSQLQFRCYSDGVVGTPEFYAKNVTIFDLTDIFGSGNEPTTAAEFEALYPLPYYAYNPGKLLPLKATGLETVGFNQWDEEWESGSIDYNTGENSSAPSAIRAKNYIPIFPNTEYYFKSPLSGAAYYYDANKNYLGFDYYGPLVANSTFTTPAGAYYMRFRVIATTHNHDICINLSWSGYRNGEYEPYWKRTLDLPLTTKTGKLNGEGTSVIPFADGANNFGTIYDEIRKDGATKRLGKRAYQAGDESDANVLTDGTNTIYALATPEEYVWDEPLNNTYRVADFGTEGVIPTGVDANGVPNTAPFRAVIKYSDDFTRELANLPKNYDTNDGIDTLCSALATALSSALNGTFTITRGEYSASDKKYAFTCTFTPSGE